MQLWIRCVYVIPSALPPVFNFFQLPTNAFHFFNHAVCLDQPSPPAVWPVRPRAAQRGQVTASGGEGHPGKLFGGTRRNAEMT